MVRAELHCFNLVTTKKCYLSLTSTLNLRAGYNAGYYYCQERETLTMKNIETLI